MDDIIAETDKLAELIRTKETNIAKYEEIKTEFVSYKPDAKKMETSKSELIKKLRSIATDSNRRKVRKLLKSLNFKESDFDFVAEFDENGKPNKKTKLSNIIKQKANGLVKAYNEQLRGIAISTNNEINETKETDTGVAIYDTIEKNSFDRAVMKERRQNKKANKEWEKNGNRLFQHNEKY